MYHTKKMLTYILLTLLGVVNIIVRYPLVPHEIGWDSYLLHAISNDLANSGYPKWWLHPLSVFGMYPRSYPSGGMFLLAGSSNLMGIDIETIINFISILGGVLSGYFAFIFAGEIRRNALFQFFVGIAFSTAFGIVTYTTWTYTTRGLFMVILPFFVFFLLKSRNESGIRYKALCLSTFVCLMSIHHLYILMLPIFFAFLTAGWAETLKVKKRMMLFAILSIILFIIPLIANFDLKSWKVYTYEERGLMEFFKAIFFSTAGQIGLLGIFGLIGFFYLVTDETETFEKLFILLGVVFIMPFLSTLTQYTPLFFIVICSALVGMGIDSLWRASKKKKKTFFAILISISLISIGFSANQQVMNLTTEHLKHTEIYMDDASYNTAIWMKYEMDGVFMSNDHVLALRLYAISSAKVYPTHPILLVKGREDAKKIKVKLAPIQTRLYVVYEEEEYMDKPNPIHLLRSSVDDDFAEREIFKFNISYVVENSRLYEKFDNYGLDYPHSKFMESVHKNKYKIYDNGYESIWALYS
ncbi:MAG: hypothetical protein AB1779_10295 [Candidatus Thermoplasmatota archaeon]